MYLLGVQSRPVYLFSICSAPPPFTIALALAAPKKPTNTKRQLTDLESELNALDTRGYSVLHYTCLHNLGALVPVLLERGADPNLRTGDGQRQVKRRMKSEEARVGGGHAETCRPTSPPPGAPSPGGGHFTSIGPPGEERPLGVSRHWRLTLAADSFV